MELDDEQLRMLGAVAHRISGRWPDLSTEYAQDLYQHLWLTWQNDAERFAGYWAEPEVGRKKLYKALTNAANAWCRKETAQIRGRDDYARYGRRQLVNLLPHLYRPDTFGSLSAHGGGRSNRPAREGGDSLATYADLTSGWDQLTSDDRVALSHRYVFELDDWVERLCDYFDCTPSAARARTARALDHLELRIAGRPKFEGRKVMSNATANAMTKGQWNG